MSEVQTEERQTHPMVQFKRDMEAMVSRELDMLDDKARSRMKSAAIVAVTKDQELLLADRQSFMGAIRMCAQHGVTPDGNEATLQVYNTKVKGPNGQDLWVKKVTYLPMIRGIINRVVRSGKIKLFYSEVVYADETFRIDLSNGDRRPVHEYDPMRRGGDNELIGAYSVAVYDDGTTDCEPMPLSEINKVRNAAKTKNVWDGWFSEKAKVAVMKRHSKRLPLSAEDMDFILNREESDHDQPRDVTPQADRAPLSQRIQAATAPQAIEADQALANATGRAVERPTVSAGGAAWLGDGSSERVTPVVAGVSRTEPDAPHWTESVAYDEAFPGTAVWDEGVKAFQSGDPVESCPYAQSMSEATDWIGGWHGAKEAAK